MMRNIICISCLPCLRSVDAGQQNAICPTGFLFTVQIITHTAENYTHAKAAFNLLHFIDV